MRKSRAPGCPSGQILSYGTQYEGVISVDFFMTLLLRPCFWAAVIFLKNLWTPDVINCNLEFKMNFNKFSTLHFFR